MNKTFNILVLILLTTSMFSCRPFSKESYLEQYAEFMQEVSEKSSNYTADDWRKADKKYKKFNEDWYKHFKEDLTWQEEITVTSYTVKYNFYHAMPEVMNMYNTYLKGDIEKLKEQIKYYKENKMDEDIKDLVEKAKQAGDSSAIVIQGLIDEVNKELDEPKAE